MVKGGSPATDFWAGGLRVGDREFVALLDSWLRSEADIPELLRIAVFKIVTGVPNAPGSGQSDWAATPFP
jgi:hypothetical protein